MAAQKMPARSITEKWDRNRTLDSIAIPLIPQMGIIAAYQQALQSEGSWAGVLLTGELNALGQRTLRPDASPITSCQASAPTTT